MSENVSSVVTVLPIYTFYFFCKFQAFRHLYVLASEARWIRTVDVDSGLPVYAPLEVTVRETEHYAETSFSDVTPCILPERSIVSSRGPFYFWQMAEAEIYFPC